jgi:hypothetical protein
LTVTVYNVNPTATLTGPSTVSEGVATVAYSLCSPLDPSGADTTAGFHYAFSCTSGSLAAATYAASSTSPTMNCTFQDGPATPTVVARIIYKDNGYTEYTIAVTVLNVAPTAVITPPTSVNEGSPVTVNLTSPMIRLLPMLPPASTTF